MDSITRIENLLQADEFKPSKDKSPYDQELEVLEHFIDKLVTATNKANKAAALEAIKKAQFKEEFLKKVAYLTAQIHQAETELAALRASLEMRPPTSADSQLLDTKEHEVLYWKARLHEVTAPKMDSGF